MMSILFNVSLDDLGKGDVKIMKEELQNQLSLSGVTSC